MRAFPWDAAMQFGFGVLRLHPDQFWAMTPRELAAALEAQKHSHSSAPTRTDLNKLINDFPDRESKPNG